MGTEQQKSEPATNPSAPTAPGEALAETLPPPGPAGEARSLPELPVELRDHLRYRIIRLLGRGGMGAVYEAVHTVMDRPVALKVMRPELTENPAAVERFRREVKAAAQLHHPNIVTAFDAEQAGGVHFLVMEYVAGRTLAEVVAAEGPLPAARAVDFIIQAAQGLQYAHERGMIHRDIKPQNLMVSGGVVSGEWSNPSSPLTTHHSPLTKILDFGLARFASEGSSGNTGSGVILGTVDYMAPEQADNAKNADIRSDIYSLGCTLYYLLSGRVPFPDGSLIQRVMAHVDKPPPPLSELRPGLPPGLIAVVAKMLAKKPADRFQTPADVINALAPFRDGAASVEEATLVALPAEAADDTGPITLLPKADRELMEVIPVERPRRRSQRDPARVVAASIVDVAILVLLIVWAMMVFMAGRGVLRGDPVPRSAAILLLMLSLVAWGALLARLSTRGKARVKVVTARPSSSSRTGLVLLGCFGLAALGILSCVGVGGYLGFVGIDKIGRGLGQLREDMKKQQQNWDELGKNFNPPADHVTLARMFPPQLGGFDSQGLGFPSPAPELSIDLGGRHATYRRNDQEFHVYAFHPVTRLEKEALYQRVLDLAKPGQGGLVSHVGGPKNDRIGIRVDRNEPLGKSTHLRAQLWWNRDWLFVVHTPSSVDPEPVLVEYLNWLTEQSAVK